MNALTPWGRTLVLTGPTACGKTSAAIKLCKRIGGEVVSADSAQVYIGMDIGTATPTLQEQDGVPHHLISVVDPSTPLSVVDYVAMAKQAIAQIHARGHWAVVCGGTGLYIESLFSDRAHGQTPPDPAFRQQMAQILAQQGEQTLHQLLQQQDPASAAAIHPHDHKRVIRALEIVHHAGQPMQRQAPQPLPVPAFCLCRQRQALCDRIAMRVDQMLQQGLVEEVRRLVQSGLPWDSQAMSALGYRQLQPYFQQQVPLQQVRDNIVVATRQYAKRQMTYFRGRLPGLHMVQADGQTADQLAEQMAAALAVE